MRRMALKSVRSGLTVLARGPHALNENEEEAKWQKCTMKMIVI